MTPPPSFVRRLCCCNPPKICPDGLFATGIFCERKHICIFLGLTFMTYYIVMDILFFARFRTVDIVKDNIPGADDELFSPFTHLGVKSLMNDHTSHYIISPLAEYFDYFTNFSLTFTFITPSMISFIHLFVAFLSGKFVASMTLADRRIGVVIFQFRTWLDVLDGVVYRSQSKSRLQYRSVRNTWGYIIDTYCDAIGGCFLCFGVLFYLIKRFNCHKHELPVVSKSQEGISVDVRETHSNKYLFWKVFCYGACLAMSGKCLELIVEGFRETLQAPMKDEATSALQFELCHSYPTVLIFYMWRLLQAQALIQYLLIQICLDNVWEFLNYTQYTLFGIIFSLCVISFLYVKYLRTTLGI